MGKRGRKPTPTAVLKVHGGYRADRHGERMDNVPVSGSPHKPEDLEVPGATLWDRIVATHAKRQTLGEVDTESLATLCFTYDLMVKTRELLKIDPTDKDCRCSYLGYLSAVDKIGAKFGWTASDRANLKMGGEIKPKGVSSRQRA